MTVKCLAPIRNPSSSILKNVYGLCGIVRPASSSVTNINPQFVPEHHPASLTDIEKLAQFVHDSERLFVLTGAGISTGSGIPDYRSEGVGLYATSKNRPVQYIDFINSADVRQRYWARNYISWPKFSSFLPNSAHKQLADWETDGRVSWLVTQNVDQLHQKAGTQRYAELYIYTVDANIWNIISHYCLQLLEAQHSLVHSNCLYSCSLSSQDNRPAWQCISGHVLVM